MLNSMPMPCLLDVLAGAEAEAYARGYSLVTCDTSGSREKEDGYLSLLLSQRVAGIIYAVPSYRTDNQDARAALRASKVPVVVISSDPGDLPYPHVRTDDVRAGYVAMRHLIDLGRRRVGVVATAGTTTAALTGPWVAVRDRITGARAAAAECGLPATDIPLYLVANALESGRAVGRTVLAQRATLDGLVITTDIVALGLIETLRERGVRVPAEVAVVGHDGIFSSSIAVPALTTVAPPRREMGRACVELLLRAIEHAPAPPPGPLEATFIARESTIGDVPGARAGRAVPLSALDAWAAWREQRSVESSGGDTAPEAITVTTLAMGREVG